MTKIKTRKMFSNIYIKGFHANDFVSKNEEKHWIKMDQRERNTHPQSIAQK